MMELLIIHRIRGPTPIQNFYDGQGVFLFETLKEKQPTFQNPIVTIGGDSNLPNLGISVIDKATLIREVSIVFNVAATVKFNKTIKLATAINVQSVRDLINLSKEMSKLKNFIHVSTAYINFLQNPIEEKFYDPPIDDDKLINLMNSMNEIARRYYTTVRNTFRKPIRRWVNNTHGLTRITANVLMGLMRTHHDDSSVKLDFVLRDMIANGIIASAWNTANNPR
ncbi:fatty acyl-CoA reductase wat-like isoform X1 [Vespula squamosa]|uniref:Fatty acyl-CoA reductase n=1 Tax=Vespula squamosa TaxID=30214 RepID=A0ABD2BS80_VESSQ